MNIGFHGCLILLCYNITIMIFIAVDHYFLTLIFIRKRKATEKKRKHKSDQKDIKTGSHR
ncbi:hypothetical protein CKG00_01055 [Morganella morganii]|uniref:Uncharacterized protein n=1 Tax=Morganella morganii TaxID=582 RepID=A0A433ZSQ7_MORMO|nr:hypothetical protein CKG00_01055 [Morganella morganii]